MGWHGGTFSLFIIPLLSVAPDPFLSLPPIRNEGHEQRNHRTARWHWSENLETFQLYFSTLFLVGTGGKTVTARAAKVLQHSSSTSRPFPHQMPTAPSPQVRTKNVSRHCLMFTGGNKCRSRSLTTSVVKRWECPATPKHSTQFLELQLPTFCETSWILQSSLKLSSCGWLILAHVQD